LSAAAAARWVREVVHADEGEHDREELLRELEQEMLQAAEELDSERAAALRDHIEELKNSPQVRVPAAQARPMGAGRGRRGGARSERPQGRGGAGRRRR
jgi:excinuclease ABC subunit B